MKKLFQNIIVLLFGIVIALAMGEIGSRILYKILYPNKPWYEELVLEQNEVIWWSSLRRNSFGLRDREYPNVKPANSRRVLIVCDSFTFGSGVGDISETFPEILEKQLDSEFSKSGKILEVLNGGIVGSMPNH